MTLYFFTYSWLFIIYHLSIGLYDIYLTIYFWWNKVVIWFRRYLQPKNTYRDQFILIRGEQILRLSHSGSGIFSRKFYPHRKPVTSVSKSVGTTFRDLDHGGWKKIYLPPIFIFSLNLMVAFLKTTLGLIK